MTQRYRIDLCYDGADFQGWQSQPNGLTVQDSLNKALSTFLRHPVNVVGASRTDTGVHAWHQVASFSSAELFEPERWLRSLQGLLPPTIGVLHIAPVPDDFHPIGSAKSKVYLYRIWNRPIRHALARQWAWHVPEHCELEALRSSLAGLIGEHDFTSFCAVDSTAQTRVRKILAAEVHQDGPMLHLWLHGTGFLKQMVRAIVGTVVESSQGRRPGGSDAMAALIAAKDRDLAGKTAPAHGLTLASIFYESNISLAHVRQGPFVGGIPLKFGDLGQAGLTYPGQSV